MNTYKKFKFAISLFSFLFVFFACKNDKKQSDNFPIQINMIKESDDISVADFVEKVDFIDLETTEESLIGIITNMYISTDKIYLLDILISRSLFVFDKSGKFITKIGNVGNGPGEYQYLLDFIVEESKNRIILLVDANKVVFTDLSGNYISEKSITPLKSNFLFNTTLDGYILANGVTAADEYLVYFTDENFEEKKGYLPMWEGYENILTYNYVNYTGFDNSYLFVPPLSPVIYRVNTTGVYPKYEFNIDEKYKLTKNKLKKFKEYSREEIIKKCDPLFYPISFFDLKDALFITFFIEKELYWGKYNHPSSEFIYATKKNMKKSESAIPENIYFLFQIDENTIAGITTDTEREEEGLNPRIAICKMKN